MDYILYCGIRSKMQAKYKWLLAILMTLVVLEEILVSQRIVFSTFNTGTSKSDHQERRLSLGKEELTPPKNTRKTSPENTKNAPPEKTENTSPQTIENISPKTTRKTPPEKTGKTVAEINRNTPPQKSGKKTLENTGNSRKTVSLITGNAPPENTGNAPPENTGKSRKTVPENTEQIPSDNIKIAPPEHTGKSEKIVSKNTGNTPHDKPGKTTPKIPGNSGKTIFAITGKTSPENTGKTPHEKARKTISENMGNIFTEKTGKTPPENTGKVVSENMGKSPPRNTGGILPEKTDDTLPEITEKIPPENTGKRVSGITVSTSPGVMIWNKMYPGFTTEEEAMAYKECEDVKTFTSPNTTKLVLKGDVTCDCKCNGTPTTPPPESTTVIPDMCYSPPGDDCSWYRYCLEKRFPCKKQGESYAIDYAETFCFLYREYYSMFDAVGQQWVDAVRKCLQVKLVPILQSATATCDEIKKTAMDSHTDCYLSPDDQAPSICDIGIKNWMRVFMTIKGAFEDVPFESLKQSILIGSKCVSSWVTTGIQHLKINFSGENVFEEKLLNSKIVEPLAANGKWTNNGIRYIGYSTGENDSSFEMVVLIMPAKQYDLNYYGALTANTTYAALEATDAVLSGKVQFKLPENVKALNFSVCENAVCAVPITSVEVPAII